MSNLAVFCIISGITAATVVYKNRRKRVRHVEVVLSQETQLSVQAINTAADLVNERIERGEITTMEDLADAVRSEIAFQEIAVREEEK